MHERCPRCRSIWGYEWIITNDGSIQMIKCPICGHLEDIKSALNRLYPPRLEDEPRRRLPKRRDLDEADWS